MPWKETRVPEQRSMFVTLCRTGRYSKSELCYVLGISRPTGDKWLARYDPADRGWPEDRPRAPERHPNATPEEVVAEILALRDAHPRWGPRKLRAYLADHFPDTRWPADSTLGHLLQVAGRIPRRPRVPRPAAWPSAQLTVPLAPNDVWYADLKGWFRLGNGQRCDPITFSDGYSRYLLACHAACCPTAADLRAVSIELFRRYGLPAVIRTDNGAPFATTAPGGLSRESVWWIKLGIRPERIQPGRPQQNGSHERMHGTLKLEVWPQADLPAQQQELDRFQQEYNTVRPHEGIGQRPPARLYLPSPRPFPETVPPVIYPLTMQVRQVRHDGMIKWRGRHLFVSECLIGEPVGLAPVDDRLWVLYFAHLPLAVLDDATGQWLPRKQARQHLRTVAAHATGAGPPAHPRHLPPRTLPEKDS